MRAITTENAEVLAEERRVGRFPPRTSLGYNTTANFHFRGDTMLKQLTEFMRRMDPNSIAIIPAAREAVRSHDTNYRYRQNSDFFYLTGFEEPDAIAIIAPSGEKKFTLFVWPRDPEREIWDGYRAGV